MTPAAWGQLAVKVILLWTALSIVFVLFVWPHLAKRMDAIQAERERQATVARQRKALDKAMALERAVFDEKLKVEASRIIKKLDDEVEAAFALDVEAALLVLEYRAAADGKKIA